VSGVVSTIYRHLLICDIYLCLLDSITPKNLKESFETALPRGIWRRFHFNDDNPVKHQCLL